MRELLTELNLANITEVVEAELDPAVLDPSEDVLVRIGHRPARPPSAHVSVLDQACPRMGTVDMVKWCGTFQNLGCVQNSTSVPQVCRAEVGTPDNNSNNNTANSSSTLM